MNRALSPRLTKVAEADFPTQFRLFESYSFFKTRQRAVLLPASENRGHNAWTAAAMQHGNHEQRVFVRSIGDQVVAHRYEPQGSQGKVGPPMPLVGKWDKIANSIANVLAVGGIKPVFGDEFPKASVSITVKVSVGPGVKDVAAHDSEARRS
jgi:hypothetical protein